MSRRKGKAPNVSLRLAADVQAAVQDLVDRTGWSAGEAASFLARTGANALGKGEKLEASKKLLAAALEHHQTEQAVKKKLATTQAKLRDARKALSEPKGR